MSTTTMSKTSKGICLIILSAFCFACMNVCVRLSGELPSIQKSFFRNFIAMLFAFAILKKGEGSALCAIKKQHLPYLVLRSIFGTLGILCNFYAVDHLLVADASILNKLSPFFAIIFSFFILKEKIRPFQAICVFLAFVGCICIVKPGFTNVSILPACIGVLGGMAAGIAYTMVRLLGTRGVKGPFIVFFFSAFSCLATLPWLLFHYTPMTGTQLGFLLLAGLFAAGGQFTITAAYTCAPAREISIYDYSQILFATLLGFFLFGEIPDALSFLGYGLIILGSLLMFLYTKNKTADAHI